MDVNKLKKEVDIVSATWKENPYYDRAEKWIHKFWDKESVFKKLFDKLDSSYVIELAAGHGRHAEQIAGNVMELVIMEVHDENLNACRNRLNKFDNIKYLKCEGFAYDGVEDNWATSIYCYDAMVHFNPNVIQSYLYDSYRVLKPGGRALFHHSNYPAPQNSNWMKNPHGRNHMTKKLFAEMSEKAGFKVLESHEIRWGMVEKLDCVSMIEK